MASDHATGVCMPCRRVECRCGNTFVKKKISDRCPKCGGKHKVVSKWTEAPEFVS